ncbi:response regulator [Pseudomonas asuensis]
MNADKALSNKTILVVEDEVFLRRLIIEVLKELDVQIVALPSADAGYDLLEKKAGEIALLVTDIRMPGHLDGVDLANIVCKVAPYQCGFNLWLRCGTTSQTRAASALFT